MAGDLMGGAGEAAVFSKDLAARVVGSMIGIPAFLRCGIWKVADLGAGLLA